MRRFFSCPASAHESDAFEPQPVICKLLYRQEQKTECRVCLLECIDEIVRPRVGARSYLAVRLFLADLDC